MNIELKPEHERTIQLALQSGACQNREEVLDHALNILRGQLESEDWMREQREEIAAHIAVGFAQAEAGELIDGTEAANRVETEIIRTCHLLAKSPLIGHKRPDVTPLPVRF